MALDSATRPWGSWEVLDDGQGYKVKRIHVTPGHKLSYQTHQHRSEHWVVIFGIATCTVDGQRIVAGPGGSIDVPTGAKHRIANEHCEELIIIEVQQGAYTGEDDIQRLEDDYGRHQSTRQGDSIQQSDQGSAVGGPQDLARDETGDSAGDAVRTGSVVG